MSDPEMLILLKAEKDLVASLPDRISLEIDNTDLTPEQVAHQIIEHYGLSVSKR